MSAENQKIQIVGAGMSGLLSAYYLVQKGFMVEVYETSPHVGGKIQTRSSAHGLRELAANAILADLEVEEVARQIGVELLSKNSNSSKRWILKNKKLRQWPLGFLSSLRLFIFFIATLLKLPGFGPRKNELLKSWGQRILGREATDYFINPACQGIFGVDGSDLSATLVFNYFFKKQKRPRGVLRGSVAPKEGMGDWPVKLRTFLEKKGVVFYLNQTLDNKNNSPVVLAADWLKAAEFLKKSGDPRADILLTVPGVDLLSVNVFYASPMEKQSPGFGALFPRNEGMVALGVLLNSHIFPQRAENAMSETWIFGGRSPWAARSWSLENCRALIARARKNLWDSQAEPLELNMNEWPQALPLYGLELERALEKIKIYENGIYLVGNYLGELGLNRLFHRAKAMAEKLSQEKQQEI